MIQLGDAHQYIKALKIANRPDDNLSVETGLSSVVELHQLSTWPALEKLDVLLKLTGRIPYPLPFAVLKELRIVLRTRNSSYHNALLGMQRLETLDIAESCCRPDGDTNVFNDTLWISAIAKLPKLADLTVTIEFVTTRHRGTLYPLLGVPDGSFPSLRRLCVQTNGMYYDSLAGSPQHLTDELVQQFPALQHLTLVCGRILY